MAFALSRSRSHDGDALAEGTWSRARPQVRSLLLRGVLLAVGCGLSTLCYAFTIRSALGLGPLFVLQQGLAKTVGISIGYGVMLVGVGLVVIDVALRSWPGPGTLVLPFMGGVMLNGVLPSVPQVHGLVLRVVVVLVASWFMALGGALVIRASVGCAAYDAVMLGLQRISRRSLAPIRVVMELSVLGVGWLLGGSVGVGTAITGLLIGPAMQFWLRAVGYAAWSKPRRG